MSSVPIICRFIAVIATLLIGPLGLFFAMLALGFGRTVVSALWTGVFVGSDLREGTGDYRILRTTDPALFWDQVEFYTVVSVVFCFIAMIIILPLVIYIKVAFERPRVIGDSCEKASTHEEA